MASQARDIAAVGGAAFVEARLAVAQEDLAAALRAQGRGRAVGVASTPLLTIAAAVVMAMVVLPWVRLGLPTPIAAMIVLVPIALLDSTTAAP